MKLHHWLFIAVGVVVLDQISKQLAEHLLTYGEPLAVMPSFNLTLLYNKGAAFSFLESAGGWQRWFFTAIALVVSVVIVFWLKEPLFIYTSVLSHYCTIYLHISTVTPH